MFGVFLKIMADMLTQICLNCRNFLSAFSRNVAESSAIWQRWTWLAYFEGVSVARNWTERGRGLLRLNDAPNSSPGHLKSR
jgi:hypothetical protein